MHYSSGLEIVKERSSLEAAVVKSKDDGDTEIHLMEQGQEDEKHLIDKAQVTQTTGGESCDGEPYEKSLPCFGCGIGWFSFIFGFAFPLMWYFAAILYFKRYHLKDPREIAGLAASTITALRCSVAIFVALLVLILIRT